MAVFSCAPTRLETISPSKKIDANWHSVSKFTGGLSYDSLERPSYHRQNVRTVAQQAILVTESLGIKQSWWGYSGPENPHTRRLKFICSRSTYSVPESFVGDLLDLHVDFPTHASIDGNNQVFSMEGCSGEKCYTVHFHFRSGRFFQRILDYNEEHNIYIVQGVERSSDGNPH